MKHPREGRRWTTRKNWAGSGWNVILRQDGRENARMSLEEWLRLSEPPFMDGGADPHRDAGDLPSLSAK